MSNQDNINDYISNSAAQNSDVSNDSQDQNPSQGTFNPNNMGSGMEVFPTPEKAQNPENGKTIEAYRSDELLQSQELLKPTETLTAQESKDEAQELSINTDTTAITNEEPHNIVDLRSEPDELHDISTKDKVTQKADEEENDFIEKVEERHAHK